MSVTYFRADDGAPLTPEEALRAWAAEAYTILVETASHYGRTISPEQLSRAVQDRTNVRSTQHPASWLGRVLMLVVHRCVATGEPPLTSLVMNPSTGMVGPAYSEVQRVTRQPSLNDMAREKAAAQGRLDSYLRYASDTPSGAQPRLATTFAQTREKATRTARAAEARRPAAAPPKPDVPLTRICPRCFLETPIDGECQNCG
ncbi:MAG TPA: hypothetical protein VFK68_07185 [Propionibacteriaceae bacterium]|nr:hypothetical protein [Propionibacteriaceae bacterium]